MLRLCRLKAEISDNQDAFEHVEAPKKFVMGSEKLTSQLLLSNNCCGKRSRMIYRTY